MNDIRTLNDLNLPRGARVFYRVDYNVPIEGDRISDATRIEETLPTLEYLRERQARVVIASHMGRPKGQRNPKYSLAPVREKLAQLTAAIVHWSDDCAGPEAERRAHDLENGAILLLENLRFHAGEEADDAEFAQQLRKLADYYVNDAFGASHRAHASIDALPRLFGDERSAGGLLLARELQFLEKITNVSERPFVALLGGAKIAGKIEPLEALVKLADTVLIGGGMANTFLAARGVKMGASLVDRESMDVARRILNGSARAEVVLPADLVVADDLEAPREIASVETSEGLRADQKAFDIGARTIDLYAAKVAAARVVFWNGPMGVFEKEPFAKGTLAMARAIAGANATTVVGGGESVEAVKASGYAGRISHISTGGGASLEFIAGAKLPGVEVLRKE
jgi:3-phosphoglycerate kinase